MENLSSVCFVGKIEQINSIEGADKIVQAVISGWECVIGKDQHKVGDLVVIATTDAVIPFELAENLGVTSYLKNRKKTGQLTVKTTKLRGVYSTALIINDNIMQYRHSEGEDCMSNYNIEKYEEPAEIIQTISGRKFRYHKNPNFHVYYKFPNSKNAPDMFTEEDEVIITRKLHGSNGRWGIVKKPKLSLLDKIKKLLGNKSIEYSYCYGSHEVEKGSDSQGFYSTDIWREVADKFYIKEKLWQIVKNLDRQTIGKGIIIYGEVIGNGVQKYYDYGYKERRVRFFDIKLNDSYVNNEIFEQICSSFSLEKVPVLYRGNWTKEGENKFLFDKIKDSKIYHEGIVVKHISGDRNKIYKVISPAYLEFQSKKEDSTDFH